VFYVTSSAGIVTLDHYRGFGIDQVAPGGILDHIKDIPPVYVPYKPVPPGDPVEQTQRLVDPVEARKTVAGSEPMRAVIGASDTLAFGGREIGATGSVPAKEQMQ
jgi:hypothetical protein